MEFPELHWSYPWEKLRDICNYNSGSNYFNYKKTFSVVLLALVDANYKFIAVGLHPMVRIVIEGFFSSSRLGTALEEGSVKIPSGEHFLGTNISTPLVILDDQAFPLKTYMLRPYPENQVQGFKKTDFQ